MKEMPGYVRAFYRELEAGRLPGMRCPHCGQVRLTYVPVCDRCKRRAPEPVELEKRGVLTVFSVRQPWDMERRYVRDLPGRVAVGMVELKDGPTLWCCVDGLDVDHPEAEWERLPLDVEIDIRRIGGNAIPVAVVPKALQILKEVEP
ncbi:MAG TPA: hypothetical protein IAC11_01190 [Candidatus Limiplasma pullicola]|nr:hypothetical protein [Candidatus Limiplasma pullicola]